MGLLIDNAGTGQLQQETSALPQSFPVKFKINSDDDYRIKAILKAQGLPTKDNIVTYHFDAETPGGGLGFYNTVTFQHGQIGFTEATVGSIPQMDIGEKIVLLDEIQGDSSLHSLSAPGLGSIKRIAFLDALPPGKAHRFTVYVMFTHHHGPLRSEGDALPITRD